MKSIPLPLTGKLRTYIDATQLSEGDFQTLSNFRYSDSGLRPVRGMTKVNTTALVNPHIRNMFFVRKDADVGTATGPILVQAWNSGDTASGVYKNTITIPNTGDFTSTALWSDSSGAGVGMFSVAPEGSFAYCNGVDSCLWYGNEARVKLLWAIDPTIRHLMHFEDPVGSLALTEESGKAVVVKNNAKISSTQKKFGTSSLDFSTTDAGGRYIVIADGGEISGTLENFTVHMWLWYINPGAGATFNLWSCSSGSADWISLFTDGTTNKLNIQFYSGGVYKINFASSGTLTASAWQHITLSVNRVAGTATWRLFIDGVNQGSATTTSVMSVSPRQYRVGTLDVVAGGYIDEYVFHDLKAIWTADFTPPTAAYSFVFKDQSDKIKNSSTTETAVLYPSSYDTSGSFLIASTAALTGLEFYVSTVNTLTSSMTVKYLTTGGVWTTAGSLSDGTSVGAVSLARSGFVSFTSTDTPSLTPRLFNGVFAYWYLVTISAVSANTAINYITLQTPMQKVRDFWDGVGRDIVAFYKQSSSLTNYTTNVFKDDYVSTDAGSYAQLTGLKTGDYLYCGFLEPQTGLSLKFGEGYTETVNTNRNLTISYWNGQAWTALTKVVDTTASFSTSGSISWEAPTDDTPRILFTEIASFYFYRISFSVNFAASDVRLNYVYGVAAPKTIRGYNFPVMFQDRLTLCGESLGDGNAILFGATGASSVFNGTDTRTMKLGDNSPLVSGIPFFSRYGGSIYEQLLVTKTGETWLVDGTKLSDYRNYRVSADYGCIAPATMKPCDLGYEISTGLFKHVIIWEAANAIVLFDGASVLPISDDIQDLFDSSSATYIEPSRAARASAFFDPLHKEYHWLFPSTGATYCDTEMCYDLRRKKWFKVDRGTGKKLQCGVGVYDSSGIKYSYGCTNDGYMHRLENGTTFDGNGIGYLFRTANIPLGGWGQVSDIRKLKLIMKTKTTSTPVTVKHYADGCTTATVIGTVSMQKPGYTITNPKLSCALNAVFHSIECSVTTTTENLGFEPIGLNAFVENIREDI